MEYLLMVYADHSQLEKLSQSQASEALAAYGAYTGALQKAGLLRGSNRLRPVHTATTVRVKSGKTEVLKQLGGYFLVDVPDLDTALTWAARCPGASHGIVEVRPVWPREEY